MNRSTQWLADRLLEIIDELREYWPLTVRQVFYQAVSRLILSNNQAEYRRVSRVLVKLREDGALRWDAIADHTRRTADKRGLPNMTAFIKAQLEVFLNRKHYGRCYIQDQDVYVEVATEKDALAAILEEAIWTFCTRLNVIRGQASATIVNAMAERFAEAAMRGKAPFLVYFGDLDPSGVAIPKALIRNMSERHGVDVELIRAALNPSQVEEFGLPEMVDAAKQKDPNYRAWLEEYGPKQAPVELDALHPGTLSWLAQRKLAELYDMSAVSEQQEVERKERAKLQEMRDEVLQFMFERFPDVMPRNWY